METKKLSRTVRRRLNRKGISLSSSTAGTAKVPEESASKSIPTTVASKKKKKKIEKSPSQMKNKAKLTAVKSETNAATRPTSVNHHKHRIAKSKVAYINSNYVSNDANDIGGRIQAELIGLRKQANNIKTASDLTEDQAHVIKRQITKLQGAEPERFFKRPKRDKTIGEAAGELALLLKKQKAKVGSSNKSTNG